MKTEIKKLNNPHLEELLMVQSIMKEILPNLSGYELASLSLQYIHTRTVSETLDVIAELLASREPLDAIAEPPGIYFSNKN
jgi:hypothetical protein